jgi:DNA sulfur modification protein DndC
MSSKDQMFLFGSGRMEMDDAIQLTIASLNEYGSRHKHWAIAWSGGKDSTATLTVVLQLLEMGVVKKPESLTVCYADTRMEIAPLWISAQNIMAVLRSKGIRVLEATAPIDKRFMVYMLGRGVPPPSNTFRWCTGQIKVNPMERALESLYAESEEKILTITGVRIGESAVRDGRIFASCSKDGAECGQGWYQTGLKDHITSTLAPIVHWRLCLVWDWLKVYAPTKRTDLFDAYPGLSGGGWDTSILADAYGGDDAEEINARTGCMGCPLASKDLALATVCKMPQWNYLSPLLELKELYREMKKPAYRIRKSGGDLTKDGKFQKNQQRMGPLTIAARKYFLEKFLNIQFRVNTSAIKLGRPVIDFLNAEEVTRIQELIDANTWPDGWDGSEPSAMELHHKRFSDGSTMLNMFVDN